MLDDGIQILGVIRTNLVLNFRRLLCKLILRRPKLIFRQKVKVNERFCCIDIGDEHRRGQSKKERTFCRLGPHAKYLPEEG